MTTDTSHAPPAQPAPLRFARLAPASLVAGPLILVVAEVLHPDLPGMTSVELVRQLPGHVGLWQIWCALLLTGALVAVPGLLRLFRIVGAGRGRILTTVGVVMALCAAVGAGGFAVMNSQLAGMAANGPVDDATAAAIQRAENDPSAAICLLFFLVGMHVGWPLVVGGATRAGLAAHWQWMLVVAGSLSVYVLSSVSHWFEPAGLLVIAVAVAPTAVRLVRVGSTRPRRQSPSALPAPAVV
jgi:hypothetical protein